MQIQLQKYLVKEFSFANPGNAEQSDEKSIKLHVDSTFSIDEKRQFFTAIAVEVENSPAFILKVELIAVFETDEDIDQSFMNSSFPVVNAPAIAFPYLRTLISNITLNFGYSPVFLPSVNFTQFNNWRVYLDDDLISEPSSIPGEK